MTGHPDPERPTVPQEREVHLLDMVAVVLRHWKLIAAFVLLPPLLGAAALMLRPKTYYARTVMVPYPEQGPSGLASMASDLPGGLSQFIGAGGGSSTERLVDAILKSTSLRERVAAQVAPRDSVRRQQVMRVLSRRTRFKQDRLEKSVVAEVRAPDGRMAADIANAIPPTINTIAAELRAAGAAYRETFLTGELGEAREKLVQTEQRVMQFQTGRQTPDLEEQSRQTVQAAAALQREIGEAEVRVGQLRRTLAPGHPALRDAESALATRRDQLRRLSSGRAGNPVFVPLQGSGQLRVESMRLLREFAADEQVYIALTAAVAQSQIDANNRLPTLGVLDAAQVPTVPERGRVKLVLVAAAVLGGVLGIVAAFLREHMTRGRAGAHAEEFQQAWRQFKTDLIPGRRRNGVTTGV